MLLQATPGYLYLYICTSSRSLNKTGQNQIFKQSRQTLVACFSVSILRCCTELRTFLIASLSVDLSPPPYNAISCSYSFFQCECACEGGRRRGRKKKKKKQSASETFMYSAFWIRWRESWRKERRQLPVFHKLSTVLMLSCKWLEESQNIW